MLLSEAIQQLLAEAPGVSAIASTRISPGFTPQKQLTPYITFRGRTERDTVKLMSAVSGLAEVRILVISTTRGPVGTRAAYYAGEDLDEAVRFALHGFKGVVTDASSPPNTIEIQRIESAFASYAYEDETDTHNFYRDFTVYAVKPTP